MKFVFVSNYMNHHQLPMAKELYSLMRKDYTFIQTEPMEEERVKMGWGEDYTKLPFIKFYYLNTVLCQKMIDEADIVVMGDEKNPEWIVHRLEQKKPILRYTERIYKEGQWKFLSPRGLYNKYKQHVKYRKNPVYLLCAGAYVASDFALIHAYQGKRYTWGYFPETIFSEEKNMFLKKKHEKIKILWAGRFIDWKHPEYPVILAKKLKEDGKQFELTMIGDGELRENIEKKIKAYGLSDSVVLTGYMKPQEVRNIMEQTNIYLFTSDKKEGWGAVLNEAMNAGCAVVANVAIGAVPSLLRPGENGLVYKNGNIDEFISDVNLLFDNPELQRKLGREAFLTITKDWNHKLAAERLYEFSKAICDKKQLLFEQGPLSEAKAIKPRKMYRHMIKE